MHCMPVDSIWDDNILIGFGKDILLAQPVITEKNCVWRSQPCSQIASKWVVWWSMSPPRPGWSQYRDRFSSPLSEYANLWLLFKGCTVKNVQWKCSNWMQLEWKCFLTRSHLRNIRFPPSKIFCKWHQHFLLYGHLLVNLVGGRSIPYL